MRRPSDLTDEYLEDGTWTATIKAEDAFELFELTDESLGADASKAKTDVRFTIDFDGKSATSTINEDDITALINETISEEYASVFVEALKASGELSRECGYTVEGNSITMEGDEFEYEDGKLVGTMDDVELVFEK